MRATSYHCQKGGVARDLPGMTSIASNISESRTPALGSYLAEPLRVGEPDISGPLAVFPVLGPEPRAAYITFAAALQQGFTIKELDRGASVNDIQVVNPLDRAVLLYEGEEVLGAQQNRTFDVTVLVPARATLRIPVSCVEHGRWDAGRHAEDFSAAPQAAYPELRRQKNSHARARLSAGLEARADQSAVWNEVASKSERHGSRSRTGAMHDVFESRRGMLAEMSRAIRVRDGQQGTVAFIGGRFSVMDWVSRPDAFAALHGPLVQGYALDALEREDDRDAPTLEAAHRVLEHVSETRASEHPAIGDGLDLRFADAGVAGAGLVSGRELVQVSAFPPDSEPAPGTAGIPAQRSRIRRP